MSRSLALLLLAAAMAACTTHERSAADTAGSTTAAASVTATGASAAVPAGSSASAAAGGAAIRITSPANGDTVGPTVKVTVETQGVTLEKANGSHVAGHGHFHLFVDTTVTMGSTPIPPTGKKIIHVGSGANEVTLTGLAAGPHRIIAVLGYGDHVVMNGAKQDTIQIFVKR